MLGINDFLSRSKERHGSTYDYSKVDFVSSKKKIEIICSKHGSFWQVAESHWNGSGCLKCSYEYRSKLPRKKSQHDFLTKANERHGNLYDYSETNYQGVRTKVKIICNKHGSFYQMASNHLAGHGCSKCNKAKSISKSETIWLDQLEISKEHRQHPILTSKSQIHVDGYDPNTNTIYEFYGDFWHGNPFIFDPSKINPVVKITYSELLSKTNEREELILNTGAVLCSIWEDDFMRRDPPVYTKRIFYAK